MRAQAAKEKRERREPDSPESAPFHVFGDALLEQRERSRQFERNFYSRQDNSQWYSVGFGITAFITFIGSWIYCIANYGFLLGVGLGWLPSLIVAVIAGAIWPLIALAIAFIVLLMLLTLK